MTKVGQEKVCKGGSMSNLGQNWLYRDGIAHSVGRNSAFAHWSMTKVGQDRVCDEGSISILGQNWLWRDRKTHFVGRDSAYTSWSMTKVGQEWLYRDRRITSLGRLWSCHDWRRVIPFSEQAIYVRQKFFMGSNRSELDIIGIK